MITGVYIGDEKIYETTYISSNQLSSVRLEGYNFDKLLGVLLSSNDGTIFSSLTCINFPRQPSISGVLIDYTVFSANSLGITIPATDATYYRPIDGIYVRPDGVSIYLRPYPSVSSDTLIDIIPFNVAGYSVSSKSLITPAMSSISTFLIL